MNKGKSTNMLPIGWTIVKLGDLCHTTSGGTPSRSKSQYYNGKIPWVKSGELDKGIITSSEEKITEEAIKNSSAKVFPKGTLLIALYGATIGKLAFLGVDAATNQAICGIYKNEKINSQFLYYFLFFKRPSLIKQGTGGAQPNISQAIIKNLDVPLPPLSVQNFIVSKIEEHFSELDKGIENLRLAQQQLKTYRQAVLKWAFEGKLTNENVKEGELPEGWKWKTLKEITSLLGDGLHGTPRYSDKGEFFFINGNNLSDGKIVFKDSTKRVDINEYQKHKKELNDTTILVSINGTLGNTAFYNGEKVILGKSACYFNLYPLVNKHYIRYIITSQRFINYAEETATGWIIR